MTTFRKEDIKPIAIDTRIAPSAITFRKKIIRLSDLPVYPAPMQEINLGSTQEVRIYSDFPLDIELGDSGVIEKYRTDMFFRGEISKIKVRTRNADTAGALVLYVGSPYLGVDWKRESPGDKGTISFDSNPNLLAGASVVDAGLSTLFAFDGSTGYAMEAMYIKSISFEREVGVIERIRFRESESGLNRYLFDHRFKNPQNIDTLVFDTPFRVSARGDFRFYGSIEAVNTLVMSTFTGVFI